MTEKKTKQKLQKHVRDASVDLADALLDLAEHQVVKAPRDLARIKTASVFMHELVGGDGPQRVPYTDVLFTLGLVLDELGRLPMEFHMHGAVGRLCKALERIGAPEMQEPAGSSVAGGSRPPGVPCSVPVAEAGAPRKSKPPRHRKFYRARAMYPWDYA